MKLRKPVIYLVDHDVTETGQIKGMEGVRGVVMVQTTGCGHCAMAKPAYQEFANRHPELKVFTVQADGIIEGERELGKRIQTLSKNFLGYPHYCLVANGRIVDKEITGRDVQSLERFCS